MQQLARETAAAAVSATECSAQLLEVAPLITRRMREMRRRMMSDLSIPQYRALNYVRNHDGISLSDLSEFLGLSLPSTSKLIQKLVVLKVVTRKAADDRRRVCISLTVKGKDALRLARQETHKQLNKTLESLSKKDLATVSKALSILGRAFSKDNHVVDLL